MAYIVAIGVLAIICTHMVVAVAKLEPRIENRVALDINGKLVLTMTNNCVFIENLK